MQCKGTRFPGFALVLPAKFAMYAISSLQKTSDERVTRLEQIPRLDSLANTRSGRQGKRKKLDPPTSGGSSFIIRCFAIRSKSFVRMFNFGAVCHSMRSGWTHSTWTARSRTRPQPEPGAEQRRRPEPQEALPEQPPLHPPPHPPPPHPPPQPLQPWQRCFRRWNRPPQCRWPPQPQQAGAAQPPHSAGAAASQPPHPPPAQAATASAMMAQAGRRLFVGAHQGNADHREKHRDAEEQCTIHAKLLPLNRYRTERDVTQLCRPALFPPQS